MSNNRNTVLMEEMDYGFNTVISNINQLMNQVIANDMISLLRAKDVIYLNQLVEATKEYESDERK